MDILIIGGSRFTGPAVIDQLTTDQLTTAGHHLTVFNRGNHTNPTAADTEHIVGDRHDEATLKSLFKTQSFDAVVDTCAYEPEDVESLIRAGCSPNRYVCYSTAGVYSNHSRVPFRETDHRGESQFWGKYGASKASLENRLFRAAAQSELPATVLRFPYIYGPGNHLYRETALFDRVQSNRPVPIPADGQTLLQFVFVDDVARAVKTVIEADSHELVGEAFNVAEPRSYTYTRLVEIVETLTESDTQTIRFVPPDNATEVFDLIPFGSRHLQMDVSKWVQFVDWEFTPLQDGLAATLDWYETATPLYDDDYAL
jgi:nucleoside-diphosphate-sugar epimerase